MCVESPQRGDLSHEAYSKSLEVTQILYSDIKNKGLLQCIQIYLIRHVRSIKTKQFIMFCIVPLDAIYRLVVAI